MRSALVMRVWMSVIALGALGGCDAGDAPAAAPDLEAAREGAEALVDVGLATALAASYFDFGVTFDLALTAEQLASAAGATVERNLAGCGRVTVTGQEVWVDFGRSPGCALATRVEVTGSVRAQVSKLCCFQGAGFVMVSLPLDGVTVDGRALAGTYTIRTPDPVRIAVASAGTGMEGIVDVVGSAETLALSGRFTTARTAPATMLELRGLVWRRGDCYPGTGTIALERGASTQTLALTEATVTTGIAMLTVGDATSDIALPAYGACPPAGP